MCEWRHDVIPRVSNTTPKPIIYDIAGEVFTDGRENEVQRQYEYCHGILFIVDPFAIPSVVAQYGDRLTPEDRAGIGHADINGVIDVFLNKLREVTGLSDQRMSHVPLAVVLSKADSAGLDEVFDAARIEQVRAEHGKKVDAFDAMDYLCRAFLREHQMHSFLSSIDMRFTTNRFFAASAIGHTRGAGHYQPRGILEPMEWICSLSDKRLHECIGTHAFTAKPLLKTKP